MLNQLMNDESGFVISSELVLIATLLVIGLIVGLAEVQSAVVQELNDVGEAIGRLNQSYFYSGFAAAKQFIGRGFGNTRFKAYSAGSAFFDGADDCDWNECALGCIGATSEGPKGGIAGGGAIDGGVRSGATTCAAVIAPSNPSCAPTCAGK